MSPPGPSRPEDGPEEPPDLDPASLKDYFAGRLPARLGEIDEAWSAVQAAGWNGEAARTFHRLAHSLAGAGSTFGFPAVTDAARALEVRLRAALQGAPPAPPEPPEDTEVAELLAALARAARS